MVFYSVDPARDLYGRLAESKVEGVFVATRDELGETLNGVADTIIGKAMGLRTLRGTVLKDNRVKEN